MKILRKLQVAGVFSCCWFLSYLLFAQQESIKITQIHSKKLSRVVYETLPFPSYYYGCLDCPISFAYEANYSYFVIQGDTIAIRARLSDGFKYYWAETTTSKYLLFGNNHYNCNGKSCFEWNFYVVPLEKISQNACSILNLCYYFDPEYSDHPSHESIFRTMIARWEKDHRCFND